MRSSSPRIISSLLCLLVLQITGKKLQSQYEASCYDKCKCNATTYQCSDLKEIDTDIFKHILPRIYPDLDTISITGNDFGTLPMDNLFGDRVRHLKVTLLELSDNGIRTFQADTFFGLPKVEYLYLRNNEIESVGSKPLNYLPNLRLLDLSAAFGDHISAPKRAEILRDILEADHKFGNLEEIILSNNAFSKIDPQIFCHIEGLHRLILAGNILESFPIKEKCLENLRLLDLRSNKISNVGADFWEKMEGLNTLDISNNPLQCDCKLEPFIKYANEDPSAFLNQQQTRCAGPQKIAGKIIFSLEKENLCERGPRYFHWIVLIIVAIGILLIYKHLRGSGRLPRFPGATFGYSELKRNDENNPSPAFV